MSQPVQLPFLILVVGATGDWAKKEIWPAMFANFCNQEYAPGTKFLGLARKVVLPDESWSTSRSDFHNFVRECFPEDASKEQIDAFLHSLYFYAANSDDHEAWRGINRFVSQDINAPENLLVILTTPTTLVVPTIKGIRKSNILEPLRHRNRKRFLMIEKPYGTSQKACKDTFHEATSTFGDGCVFPVDHYLVKQLVLELGSQRRNSTTFNSIYDHSRLSKVLIVADEPDCLDDRHKTYQSMEMGVFADMFLGHLMPLAVWMAMYDRAIEHDVEASYVRASQLDLLSKLTISPLCWGQYTAGVKNGRKVKGYKELGSSEYLKTPTFFACRVEFREGPLTGVPFFIRTGKCLDKKHTEIRLCHKRPKCADTALETAHRFIMYSNDGITVRQNLLIEETLMRRHRPEYSLAQVATAIGGSPTGAGASFRPYEKLILSAMEGNFKDFPSIETLIALYGKADEIWAKYEQEVEEDLHRPENERKILIPYAAGSAGPDVPGFPDY